MNPTNTASGVAGASTPSVGPGTGRTPTPWFAGCQNDALFIVAGRPPALNNDHPWHEAPRVAVAKMLRPSEGDCLPVNPDANAAFIVKAANCHDDLVEALERARAQMARIIGDHNAPSDCYATGPLTGDAFTDLVSCPSCEGERMLTEIDGVLARARSELGK